MSYLSFIIGISAFLLALTIAVAVPGGIVFYRWRHRMFDTRLMIACDEVLDLMEQIRAGAGGSSAALLQQLDEAERHMFALDHGVPDAVSRAFHEEASRGEPDRARLDSLIEAREQWLAERLAQPYGPPWASKWLEYKSE